MLYGYKHSKEAKEKIRRAQLGRKHTKKTKRKMSLIKLKNPTKYWSGKKLSREHKENIRMGVARVMSSVLRKLKRRPTSLEKQMIDIIRRNNLPYTYTGDGSFLIGYKNPDFVNINGEKICVEVANTFHHSEDYPIKRINHFKKWGWDCIVFRTDELIEKNVTSKLGNNRIKI